MSDRPPRWSERRAIGGWRGARGSGGGTWHREGGERIYKLEKLFLASSAPVRIVFRHKGIYSMRPFICVILKKFVIIYKALKKVVRIQVSLL